MDCLNKKIKLDPDIVKKEPQEEEEGEKKDGTFSFEEVLVETREGNSELEPEHSFIKTEIKEEQVEVEQDMEEIDKNEHEMSDGDPLLYIEGETKSKYTTAKFSKNNKPTKTVRDFMCTICNYATQRPIDFTRHWLSHEEQSYTHENGVFVCQISDCFYVAPNERDLLKHIASQHLYRYRCDFCYYVTFSEKDYEQHRTTHSTYQCVKCNLQSTKHFFVQDHVEPPFKCEICDFASFHWFSYRKHISWHEYPPDWIVACGFCDFTTGDQALLAKHKAVHCTKFMSCKICRFTGLNTAELAKHWENVHDTTIEAVDKLHKCKFCTCKFIGLGPKEKHEELHLKSGASLKCCSNSTTVQCPYCNHQDNQRYDMNLHIKSKHAAELELDGFGYDGISPIGIALKNLEDCDVRDIDECSEGDQGKHEADQEASSENTPNYSYEEITVVINDIAEDQGNEDLEGSNANKTRQIFWRCPMCPHLSKTTLDITRHLTTMHKMPYVEAEGIEDLGGSHANKTRQFFWRCSMCPHLSKTKFGITRHLTTKHKMSYIEAEGNEDLGGNHANKTRQIFWRCPMCIHLSKTKFGISRHLIDVHKVSYIESEAESKIRFCMPTEQELKTDAPRYTCSFCHYVTPSKENYDFHCNKHTTFKCNKCSFVTTKRLFVEDHIENPWGCSKCKFKTHHWLPMKSHSFCHNKQMSTLLKCKECDFETRRSGVLKTHSLTHKSELLQCKVCLYKTKHASSLQAHYTECHDGILLDDASLSSDDRPYECDLCACKFKQQLYLDKHRTLHGENGPFRSKCSQCHQTKKCKTSENVDNSKGADKHNSWSECPYCSYEDEVRYRMMEHLSQIHQEELEIEGYRFDDCQTEEIVPHTVTSIENPPAKMTSSTEVSQKQGILRTTSTDNAAEGQRNENVEFGMKIKENTVYSASDPKLSNNVDDSLTDTHEKSSRTYLTHCSVCNFSSDQGPEYIREHMINEHVQRVFRCNICGCAEKEMHLINEHMHKEHPPLTTSSNDGTKKTMLLCAACGFTAKKRKCVILIHMLNKHVTKEEPEGNDFSQINPYYFIEKYKTNEQSKKMFRCDICSCSEKEQYLIQKHVEKQHPPLREYINDANKGTMFLCPVCHYTAKRKCIIYRHIYANHVTEETVKVNASSQITDREQPKNDNDVMIKHEKEPESKYGAYQHNSMGEEEDIDRKHRPIEQILIKGGATSFAEEESLKDTISEDNTNSESAQYDQNKTQIVQKLGVTSKLVPIYREYENRWCCPVCRYSVSSRKHLVEKHIDQVHSGGQNISWCCETCSYRSKTEASLRQHMALIHRAENRPKVSSKEITCKQPGCDFKAPTVDELSMHMARHLQTSMQEAMVYKCEVCGFGTVSKTIFRNHKKSCNADPILYCCHNCDFKSESKKGIWLHIYKGHRYRYTRKKGDVCRKCGKFSKDSSWKEYHHIYCGIRGSEY